MIILLVSLLLFSFGTYAQEPCTISKIKIKSSLLGKDRFLQHYLQEAGDLFDQKKHARSLAIVRDELIGDGYLQATVKDTLSYDEQRKTAYIMLYLDQGAHYTIADVTVSLVGRPHEHEALEKDVVDFLSGPLQGEHAQKKLIDAQGKRVRSLLVKRGYISPDISLDTKRNDVRNTVTLQYVITLDKRHEYRFVGNDFFSDGSLLNEVISLEEQGIFLPPSLIAQDIIELYKKKGYMKTEVEWHEEDELVTFFIKEGPRYTIRHVSIQDEFTDSEALDLLHRLERALTELPAYDQELVDSLLAKATKDLANYGYWDISFDKKIEQSHDVPKVVLNLAVRQETQSSKVLHQTVIVGVKIPGYQYLLAEQPFDQWVQLTKPCIVRPKDVDEQRRWLILHLRQQGYLLATVHYEIETTDEGSYLVWHINDETGPVSFGPIQIAGLHKMRPFIVQRELCFSEGDTWDPQKLEESVTRLKKLNMFESIGMHPQQAELVEGEDGSKRYVKSVLIKCCEDDPIELRTRLGLQFVSKSFTNVSWTTWKLGGSFIWKNPTGHADRLFLDADWTRYTRNIAGTYELPWIGPIPVKTQFKLYSDRFDQPLVSSSNHRLYKEAHDGASLTFFHVHPLWSTCFRTGFEVNEVFGIQPELAPVIQFEPTLVDTPTPYVYVEPSVTFEHFDDKNDPTRGYFTTLALKAMVPPGLPDGWFVRASFEQSFFYPLHRSLIGAIRWRIGHIFNAKFSTILPTQRFYLGGASSLRGYETNMAPPLNEVTCDGKNIWVPVGGKTMVNINTELRFPLYKRLSGVLFTDMGILTQDKIADIAAKPWLGSSGFGLRFASPVGPLRFDIGWKWKKRDPKDKAYAFFLTFGHAF